MNNKELIEKADVAKDLAAGGRLDKEQMERFYGGLKEAWLTGSATFSLDQRYRYALWRGWEFKKPVATFIGLNPSTADASKNDATITRCINFAKSWGCGGLRMLNLFAFRATKPKVLKASPFPVGDANDHHIIEGAKGSSIVVCAWGADGNYKGRDEVVLQMLADNGIGCQCLGTTKAGHPRHPLYLKRDTQLIPFRGA